MAATFLESYRDAFDRIEGWFSPDAALMFMAYNAVIAAHGVAGDVLEIGVHHGLSTIAIAALRGEGARLVAIDLFDQLQDQNTSVSGHGSRATFERNMRAFYGDTRFIRCIASASGRLTAADLGDRFSFCHVDGGHSAAETYADLALCSRILTPGGLLALDDYFNPAYPGVSEGAIKFWLTGHADITPIAVGFNKVLFQKMPAPFDLDEAFDRQFSFIPYKTTTLWETPVRSFGSFAAFIDFAASTPRHLVASPSVGVHAELTTEVASITATHNDAVVHVPVRVVNRSSIPFEIGAGGTPFGLSYHLIAGDGRDVQFDNRRDYFQPPLAPGEARTVDMVVDVPEVLGDYKIEIDIVWEGIMWLKQRGLEAPRVALTVV